MSYTEEQIHEMAEGYLTLHRLMKDYFWERYDADPKFRQIEGESSHYPDGREFRYRPSIEKIETNGDTVYVRCEARACGSGCCGYDTHTFEFPLSYLWQDQSEILADMARRQEEARQAEQERRRTEAARQKKAREESEKKQLRELAAKYPNLGASD